MRARIMRVLSHGTWHVYAQQIAYGLYLRTGVLTTVYILRLGWHGSVQGGGGGGGICGHARLSHVTAP